MSEDYTYVSITSTGTDTFTAAVDSSGDTSGDEGAYIPAFDVSTLTDTALTLESPSAGNIQLISMTVFIEQMEDTTINITTPSNAIDNGAGKNNTLNTRNIPIVDAFNVAGTSSSRIGAATISFSTTTNHNLYVLDGGLDIFGDIMYTLRF